MRPNPPRVAYFPDTFHEVNGVAHTSRHFEAFARRRNLPFLCVRAGSRELEFTQDGNVSTLELPRGAYSFPIEKDLRFDLAYWRYLPRMMRALRSFRPEIVHITGPSELGMVGAWMASRLKVPLVASWHTNVHQYAARRAGRFTRHLATHAGRAEKRIEDTTLWLSGRFYRLARILFAPNEELCRALERVTARTCFLMSRGVDTHAFSPEYRDRDPADTEWVLGFVGRLSVEKNVALLVQLRRQLLAKGFTRFRFLIVGHGGEEVWLRAQLPNAEFPGVLRGAALARAYANMDLFVFPSHTDTFGNVVLEALASGVPAIVTPDGGPAGIVRDGATGIIAPDAEFAAATAGILDNPELHAFMRQAARAYALTASWDAVFESVYSAYETVTVANKNGAAT